MKNDHFNSTRREILSLCSLSCSQYASRAAVLQFNVERCEEILERGKALGFIPDEAAVERMIVGGEFKGESGNGN